MNDADKNTLEKAFEILSKHKTEVGNVLDKSVLVVFDLDGKNSYTEVFENKEEFMDRFRDEELDCEGFSWALWSEGQYNRVDGNGCYYHLIKLSEV